MNNKGFTLVEIISIIVILGIVITISVPLISNASLNVKKKTLNTKIDNIEKAAILYAQENRENFDNYSCSNCSGISNDLCSCYNEIITVSKLLDEGILIEDKLDGTNKVIVNPIDENKYLNNCEVQVYMKYDKIYADYINDTDSDVNTECWYQS